MDHLRRTLSLGRRKRDARDDGGTTGAVGLAGSGKPLAWQDDERKVREGTCSFQVKYLGSIEVFESRGMEVCEEAAKVLRSQNRGKHQCVVLYVSSDALRVVDEISKGLIVDQTIEKVSFCAPDRNHEKGFAYICRDGTTRRWLCHGFLARKESGERLSHAVGCAFAVCLEKKQKREREAVQVTYSDDKTAFTRIGSFRQATLIERMVDPQAAIVAEPVAAAVAAMPVDSGRRQAAVIVDPAAARERPLTNPDTFARAGSFREFSKLASNTSPFKRQLSLRLNAQPASSERLYQGSGSSGAAQAIAQTGRAQPVDLAGAAAQPEMQTGTALGNDRPGCGFELSQSSLFADPISAMCQQLSNQLSSLTANQHPAPAANVSHIELANGALTHYGSSGVEAALRPYPLSSAAVNSLYARSSTPPPAANDASCWPKPATLQSGASRQYPTAGSQPGTQSSHFMINATGVHERHTNGGSQVTSGRPNMAVLEQDPFDAAWALRAAAGTAANPFLSHREPPPRQQQQQQRHYYHHQTVPQLPPLQPSATMTQQRGFEAPLPPPAPAFVLEL